MAPFVCFGVPRESKPLEFLGKRGHSYQLLIDFFFLKILFSFLFICLFIGQDSTEI